MKNIYNIILLILLIIFSNSVFSQKNTIDKNKIIGKAVISQNKTILIRWAPASAQLWVLTNKYGFEVIRYTITRDLKILKKPEIKKLGIFKPKPLEDWKDIALNDDYAAIMAQAIYGENFKTSGMKNDSDFIDLANEQQQRFTWGLYAAEQNFKIAIMAGLGLEDKDIKSNEKYLYKIKTLIPPEILKIDELNLFTGLAYYQKLPRPMELIAHFKDKNVLLIWNYKVLENTYNSYYIERSEDGNNFIPITKKPITTLSNHKNEIGMMMYMDTIPNFKTFYYRIQGINAFGEKGPFSEVVKGSAKPNLKARPTNLHFDKIIDNEKVLLKWNFPKKYQNEIVGFELNRSDNDMNNYETVYKNIPPDHREIEFSGLKESNYFTVSAIGKYGDKTTSLSILVQPVDSIPPSRPTGLTGEIDSLGVVKLKWNKNTEKDLLGYRIYRGNLKNEELSQITVSPHKDNFYIDTIAIKNLNPKVYYKIIAVDKRYNQSDFSDLLELTKPDVVPPSSPVIKKYKILSDTIEIIFIKSFSKDVKKYLIYRKENNKDWKTVDEINKPDNKDETIVWHDRNIQPKKIYSYHIVAVDQSGLYSKPSPDITLETKNYAEEQIIKKIMAKADRKNKQIVITWKTLPDKDIQNIWVYKAVKGEKPSLLRELVGNKKGLIDLDVHPNNYYIYLIRAGLKNGKTEKLKKIEVKY